MFLTRVMLKHVNQCVGTVIDVEKFSPRLAVAPDVDELDPGLIRMEWIFLKQGGYDMARLEVEVIAWAVPIRGHGRKMKSIPYCRR